MQTRDLPSSAPSEALGAARSPGSAASPEHLSSYTALAWKERLKWVQTSALSRARLPERCKLAFVATKIRLCIFRPVRCRVHVPKVLKENFFVKTWTGVLVLSAGKKLDAVRVHTG